MGGVYKFPEASGHSGNSESCEEGERGGDDVGERSGDEVGEKNGNVEGLGLLF